MDTLDELEVEEGPSHVEERSRKEAASSGLRCPVSWPERVHDLRPQFRSEDENEPRRIEGVVTKDNEKRFEVDEIPEDILDDLFEAPLLFPTQSFHPSRPNTNRRTSSNSKQDASENVSPLRRISNLPLQAHLEVKSRKNSSKDEQFSLPVADHEDPPQALASTRPLSSTVPSIIHENVYIPGPAGLLQRDREAILHTGVVDRSRNWDQEGNQGHSKPHDVVLNSSSWKQAMSSIGNSSCSIRELLEKGIPRRIPRILVCIAKVRNSMDGGACLDLEDASGATVGLVARDALSGREDHFREGNILLLENVAAIRVSENEMALCILSENVGNLQSYRPALPATMSTAVSPTA